MIPISIETGLGHPGQPGHVLSKSSIIIQVWPGLNHVRCEIKKSTIWKCNDGCHCNIFLSWATSTFCNDINFAGCMCTESHAPYFLCACVCTNCHLQLIQNHTHCCRNSTPAVCQEILLCSKFIAYMKPLFVSANLRVATPTDPSRYLFIIAGYLQCIINTISECVPQFSNPGHIWVWPGLLQRVIRVSSCDLVSMLIPFYSTTVTIIPINCKFVSVYNSDTMDLW